jgi:hypothetical protein
MRPMEEEDPSNFFYQSFTNFEYNLLQVERQSIVSETLISL